MRAHDSDTAFTAQLYSEAAATVGICKLLWIYSFAIAVAAVCYSIYLAARMVFMWKAALYSQALSPLNLSILVGTDVGLLAIITSLVFLIPRMIMTWVTALVFSIIFDCKLHRGSEAVQNGKKLAREISRITLLNALKGGEIVAMVAAMATLVGLALLRAHVSDWTGLSLFG